MKTFVLAITLLFGWQLSAQTLAPPTQGFEYGKVVASGHPRINFDTCAIQSWDGKRVWSLWTKCKLGDVVEFRIEKDKFIWRQPDGKEKKFSIKSSVAQ